MRRTVGRILAAAMVLTVAAACEGGERGERVEIEEDSPGLAARATIDGETAKATALARVAGGEITGAELEEEGGRLVYSFDITVSGSSGVEEIWVDAMTGEVVSEEHESEADEAAEAEDDHEAENGDDDGGSGGALPAP